jgi:hypothetical protein
MKRLPPPLRLLVVVPAVLLLLPLAGCSSNNLGKIEGTKWTSEAGIVKGQKVPAGALRLEFAKDGKMSYQVAGRTFKGTYAVSYGDYVTFNFEQPLQGRNTHSERVTIQGKKMTMTDTDGTSLSFTQF